MQPGKISALSLPALGLHGLVMSLLIYACFLSTGKLPLAMLTGAGIYLAWSQGMRFIVLKHHRRGLRALRRQEKDTALAEFTAQDALLRRFGWLDRFRYLLILSPSRMPYREISLLNVAATHASKGDVSATRNAYIEVLQAFPENQTAAQMLAVIEAASSSAPMH